MSIEAVASVAGPNSAAPARIPKQTMDGEMFMQLLVTQLKNQDPSSPMDTNAMMAQTTQLAMMERLTEMATTSGEGFSLQMRSAASALLGKTVSYRGADGIAVSGTATSVSFDSSSTPKVTVNGASVPMDTLTGIKI